MTHLFSCLLTVFICTFFVSATCAQDLGEMHPDTLSLTNSRLHFVSSGDESKPGLLFLHGTPGSWQAFAGYLRDKRLQQDFFMVSVDRPGWGLSAIQAQDKNSLKESKQFAFQTDVISQLFKRWPNKQWILVGHSLGASLAPQIAIANEAFVKGMVLLAGSLHPDKGRGRWYNLAANTLLIRWMLPSSLKESNDEIMLLRSQLLNMENTIKQQRWDIDVVIVQGAKDKLVSPKNPLLVKQLWSQQFRSLSINFIEDAGHFIPWENRNQVIDAVYQVASPKQ